MLTMRDPLAHATRHHAERIAVVDGERRLTFSELHARCARLGGALRSLGVQPGDRVAILAANGHPYLEAFFGVPSSGMVLVPLNTRLAEPELVAILEDCRPRVLLSDRDPGRLAHRVDRVVSLRDGYEALLAGHHEAPAPAVAESDLAALFYTGGTTGTPKGVMLTHRNLVANAMHKIVACSLSAEDRFLAVAAMFHVAGIAPLVSLAWLGAMTVTLPAFDAEQCLDAVERHALTVMMPVPTMLAALAEAQARRPRDVRSLRMIGHAGSSIANSVIEAAHAAFPAAELAQFYGATETASIVTCLRNEEALLETALLGTCGRATPGVAVRVVRIDGSDCNAGEVGEILVRGPNVMAGYWNQPDVTAAALAGGWYHTGDLGSLREDGHLFVLDRKKDMIVSGAENVYSVEVEDALSRHPAVLEAAVFGVPDPVWGEAVHAVVVVREEQGLTPEALALELRAHCRSYIAGYKVPKRIEVQLAPLPKSGPGKILKRALRERFSNEFGAPSTNDRAARGKAS
jgi:long-chain acyl-CoA synthetase